jgi:uncharacterized protein YukE
MADETLDVDTDKMVDAASGLSALGDQAGNIFSTLSNRLFAAGPAWGGDATGQAFLSTYQTPRDTFMETATGITSSMGDTYQRAITMAAGFNTTEEDNAASINLGGGDGGDGGSGGSDGGSGDGGSDDGGPELED